MLEYIILGFLLKNDLTGYDLKQRMTKSTSFFFDASFGSIYPALKRLQEKKFITSQEIKDGGKTKNIYHILQEGEEYFKLWLLRPVEFSKTKNDFLVKIFFYKHLPKETAITNLNRLIETATPFLNQLKEQKLEIESFKEKIIFEYSTLLYGIHSYELIITSIHDLIKQIKEMDE
ncbi:MAG: PadR-family transcriptional regulator [Anaerocolumna sp.]|nr:PadR-family transcriptional regulator [Anaerocolumna sp.]